MSPSAAAHPAWRVAVLRALEKNKKHMPYAKYFQLATVKPDGKPANRTVVYRGFRGDTADVTVVTDLRSEKVAQIRANPAAEFAWYFPDSREQFRIAGDLVVVDKDGPEALAGERRAAWNRMSPGGKAQFEWPTPGFPRLDDEEAKEGGGGGDPFDVDDEKTRQGSPASENFCYVVMTVNEVDHLSLRTNRRYHHVRSREEGAEGDGGGWVTTEVNP